MNILDYSKEDFYFSFFDEPIELFKDDEIDLYFERENIKYESFSADNYKYYTSDFFNIIQNLSYNSSTYEFKTQTSGYGYMTFKNPKSMSFLFHIKVAKANDIILIIEAVGGSNVFLTAKRANGSLGVYYLNKLIKEIPPSEFNKYHSFKIDFDVDTYKNFYIVLGDTDSAMKISSMAIGGFLNKFEIKRDYNNINCDSKIRIKRKYNNDSNYIFERIAFIQPPPKRLVIKNLDDE